MRKKAGLMLMTLLLLIVPVLANAWTLTVKVAGGTAAQAVSVAYRTSGDVDVAKTLKVGTNYLYPKAGVTFTAAGAPTFMIDGAAADLDGVNALAAGPHTVTVTYVADAVEYSSLSLTQSAGGQIYAQNRNNTWNASQVTGYVRNAAVPVTIAADGNHRIVSYTLNGTDVITAGVNGLPGQVLALSAPANGQSVSATFGLVGRISASLFAPTNGSTGKAVNCSVTATSNATNLRYAFAVTGPASFTQAASSNQNFSFTPAAVGTYTVTTTVTSDGAGSTTSSASIVVADAQTVANNQCVSCHSSQPSVHSYNAVQASCTACHSDQPHDATVAIHVDEANCSACHAASVTTLQASTHYTKPSGALACTDCHAAGDTPTFIAESCAGCHAVVDDHTEANLGGKACIQCHDRHNPSVVTGSLGPQTAHPAVTLYTFEEVGYQMNGGQPVPVQVDASGKGMPYSPKMTCGTAGCHVKNGVDYTYDKISDHAFHSNEGRSEYQDSATGKFDATKNKPWTQSTAMVGKW